MIRHWFGDDALEGPHETRFKSLLLDGVLSPAALEGMCAEHDTIEELLAALDAHPALIAARAKGAAAAFAGAGSGRK